MKATVVVAGAPAARLIRRVLNDACVAVEDTWERSSAMMRAARLAGRDEQPVVLVLDSDSLEERPQVEDRLEIGGYLHGRSGATPSKLVLAVPQVEAVLFHDRAGLERALGRRISDEDAFEGRFRPKAVFRRLAGEGAEHDKPYVEEDADGNVTLRDDFEERALAVIDALDEAALARMGTHPIIREIAEFVAEVEARGGYEEPVAVRRAG